MIRKFQESDLEPCARLLMSVYNNETWQCLWTFEKAKEYLKEIFEFKNFIGFTLIIDNEVKGAILCRAGFTLLTNRYTPAPNFYRKNGFCDGEHVLLMYKVIRKPFYERCIQWRSFFVHCRDRIYYCARSI